MTEHECGIGGARGLWFISPNSYDHAVPMETSRIVALLQPYYEALSPAQAEQISIYLDKLILWNSRMNLTSVRDPESIVIRHFGESLFLARHLRERKLLSEATAVLDIGSGAGFPGIPLQIAHPEIRLTLIEAHGRKAVFLKEILRALALKADVKNVRAEDLPLAMHGSADVVTLRAVEKFERILPVAAQFVRPGRFLAILVGKDQVSSAQKVMKNWQFNPLLPIPGSQNRGIVFLNQNS